MRLCLIILILLESTLVFAAGDGIPWPTIIAQFVNVTAAILILSYLLKDTVKELFIGRVEKFDEEFKRAQEQKRLAIERRDEIKKRLEDLKINADKSIQEAKVNAQNNTSKGIALAKENAQKLIVDSESKIMNEKNKMVGALQVELLTKSFQKAREGLSDSMSKPELEKLNNEFIKNIQVVQ